MDPFFLTIGCCLQIILSHLFVHVLPVLYARPILLLSAFARYTLIDLASRMTPRSCQACSCFVQGALGLFLTLLTLPYVVCGLFSFSLFSPPAPLHWLF
jgi:hypothetical protein